MKQYEDELAEPLNRPPPLGLNGDGVAGTGKSYLTNLLFLHRAYDCGGLDRGRDPG